MKRLTSFSVLLLACGLFLLAAGAGADRFHHATPRQIKCAVLLIPSTILLGPNRTPAGPWAPLGQNLNPYVFYVADSRKDLKPENWELVNPLAPATVTDQMAGRWARIQGNALIPPGRVFGTGTPLTKDMAPYWEAVLAPENMSALRRLDIVYIAAAGIVSFTIQEREMLRRLADAGVCLWFDDPGVFAVDPLNGLFLPLNFTTGAAGGLGTLNTGHPLLSGVYTLTASDLARLGDGGGLNRAVSIQPESAARLAVLQPVQPNGSINTPYIAAARYGSGSVVATAGNVGGAINAPVGGSPANGLPNSGVISGVTTQAASSENLKFFYNLVAWTGEQDQYQRGARRLGSSNEQLPGVVERWSYPVTKQPAWIPPLISHGQVFAATQSALNKYLIHSFEVNPQSDYNFQRTAHGNAYDEIGQWIAPSELVWVSGMALAEQTLGPNLNDVPVLFVTGGRADVAATADPTKAQAVVYALAAPTPGNPQFVPITRWVPAAAAASSTGRNIFAPPAYFEGVLYTGGGTTEPGLITGSGGELIALTLTPPGGPAGQFTELWHSPPGNAYTSIGPIVSPPAVAYVTDQRTGAVDLTVFFTTLQSAASPGLLGGIVVSTFGEALQPVSDNRTFAPNRRTEAWDPQRWWDIRVVDNTTGLTAIRYFFGDTRPGSGSAQVEFNVDNQPGRMRLPAAYDPSLFTIFADYSPAGLPDNGTLALNTRRRLPTFNPPGVQPQPSGIASGPAVGKDDIVYYATGNGYMAGAQFAGDQSIIRWKARIPGADAFSGQSQFVSPADPNRLSDYAFVATPAVTSDMVYFAGRNGTVYAFEANPTFTMQIPSPPDATNPVKRPMHSARGPNTIIFSNEGTGAPRTNRVPGDSFTVDAESGTVTITNWRNLVLDLGQIALDSAPGRVGSLQTYPVLGNRPGIPIDVEYVNDLGQSVQDTVLLPVHLVYKFTTGTGTVFPTADRFSATPVVMGDSVFVTGESGLLYELPADPRKEDPEFLMGTELATYAGGSFVRARTVAPPPPAGLPLLAGPAVANGLMAFALPTGVTAFQSPTIQVADANRVLELAGDGSVLTTMDSTVKHLLAGSDFPIPSDPLHAVITTDRPVVTQKTSFNSPARIHKLSRASSLTSIFFSSAPTEPGIVSEHSDLADESTLTADTGNNRVVETNAAGKVVWEAKGFQDPFRLLPPGEPLTLAGPLDAQRWVDTQVDPLNPNGTPLLVIHTLIADTGNNRVLELVDKIRYRQGNFTPDSFVQNPGEVSEPDPKTGGQELVRWYHVLVWASQTNAQGLHFAYRTAQRVPLLDATGQLLPNAGVNANVAPRPVMTQEPYLPLEPYQMTTLVTVPNLQVLYETNPSSPNYGYTQRNIPLVRPGGDSVLFLQSNRTDTVNEPFRKPDPTAPNSPERIIYVQGTVDASLPILRDIWDYDPPTGKDAPIHTLLGVASVQRTVRWDRWIDTKTGQAREGQAIWYLVADQGGVFEIRFDPSISLPQGSQFDPRSRLAWAFTNDDYNWVTGGGNGSRTSLRDNQNRYIGGRLLTASSAEHLPNGQVLIVSRTAPNPDSTVPIQGVGGDILMLRAKDYNPTAAANGWHPDEWVQRAFGAGVVATPSITWRAPAPRNPRLPPGLDPAAANFNPLETRGSYAPEVPVFADLIFP